MKHLALSPSLYWYWGVLGLWGAVRKGGWQLWRRVGKEDNRTGWAGDRAERGGLWQATGRHTEMAVSLQGRSHMLPKTELYDTGHTTLTSTLKGEDMKTTQGPVQVRLPLSPASVSPTLKRLPSSVFQSPWGSCWPKCAHVWRAIMVMRLQVLIALISPEGV